MKTAETTTAKRLVRFALSALGVLTLFMGMSTAASAHDGGGYRYREMPRYYDAPRACPPRSHAHGHGRDRHVRDYRPAYYAVAVPGHEPPRVVYYGSYPYRNRVDIRFEQRY